MRAEVSPSQATIRETEERLCGQVPPARGAVVEPLVRTEATRAKLQPLDLAIKGMGKPLEDSQLATQPSVLAREQLAEAGIHLPGRRRDCGPHRRQRGGSQ